MCAGALAFLQRLLPWLAPMVSRPPNHALKERGVAGLCGPYAIVNALGCLLPLPAQERVRRGLAREIAATLPESVASLMRDGTDREQLLAMLGAAQAITRENEYGAWSWTERHPRPTQPASTFWAALHKDLLSIGAVAIVGFGDTHHRSEYYEPHWTCVHDIRGGWVVCLDSNVYDRVRIADTGIRPEPGWEIEDCFILHRGESGQIQPSELRSEVSSL